MNTTSKKASHKRKTAVAPTHAVAAPVERGSVKLLWLLLAVLVIATAVPYLNMLHAPFILDDLPKIVNNHDITSLSHAASRLIFKYKQPIISEQNDPSRPVTYFTYMLNYHYGKLEPFGWHLVNLLLHLLNVILVFFFTRRLLMLLGREALFTPFFVALLFGAHPINISTVSYAFSRSDLLATGFYLSAILLFLHAVSRRGPAAACYIAGSLICFVLALFSKQNTVTLPGALLLIDFVFLARLNWKDVLTRKHYHLLYLGMFLAYLLFRQVYFGAIGDLEAISTMQVWQYMALQPLAFLRYFQLLLIPYGYCFDHGLTVPHSPFEPRLLAGYAFFAVLIAGLVIAIRKREHGIVPLFALLWFFVTISPTSSFLPTTSALVENRLYLSGVAIYLPMVLLMMHVIGKKDGGRKTPILPAVVIFALYYAVLGSVTYARNQLMNDPLRLWQSVIKQYPRHARAHNNLGNSYIELGETDKALREFEIAVALQPKNPYAHNNLANMYYQKKAYDKAITEYQDAVRCLPSFTGAYKNLGTAYFAIKDYDHAIEAFQQAIDLEPHMAELYHNLGVAYYRKKEYQLAVDALGQAAGLGMDTGEFYANFGNAHFAMNDYAQAVADYQRAIDRDPKHVSAHCNLGAAYFNMKQYDQAEAAFEKALTLDPERADARANLQVVKQFTRK